MDTTKDIFERDRAGEMVRLDDPDYHKIFKIVQKANRVTTHLNNLNTDNMQIIRDVFSLLLGRKVDDTFYLVPPFYADLGENIHIGKHVFVNHACTFMDRGGITLEDNVLIGPKVNLITTNHPSKLSERRNTVSNLS